MGRHQLNIGGTALVTETEGEELNKLTNEMRVIDSPILSNNDW